MAALTELVSDIRASIPEIPGFIAERQLLRAARTFCEETRAWRESFKFSVLGDIPTVSLVAGMPSQSELIDIISIKNVGGGEPVHPRTYSWLDQNLSDWRSNPALNANYYVLDSNNVIRLVPTPSTTTFELYDARVAIKPTLAATTLDDVLVNKYRETFIDGALGLLYLVPRKPWTDLNLAQFYHARFASSWDTARAKAADEFQTGVPRKVKYGGL